MNARLATMFVVLALTGCEKRDDANPRSLPAPAAPPTPAVISPPSTGRSLEPLLKTERVTVMAGGMSWNEARIATEIDAVLADIRTLPPSAARDRALATALGAFAKTDPHDALERIAAWDDARISFWLDAASKAVTELAKTDREAAAHFIETRVPRPARVVVWGEFLRYLPPADQAGYLDRIPASSEKQQLVTDLLHAWTDVDPAASAAWLDSFVATLSPRDLQRLRQRRRYTGGIPTDPLPLLEAAGAAATPEARKFFAEVGWARVERTADADLAGRFARFLPDLAGRQQDLWIREDPAGFAAEMPPESAPSLPAETRARLIESWARSHPADAFDWAARNHLPEAALALGPLYSQAPDEAATRAKTLPKSKELDAALSHLTHMIAMRGDPAKARELLPHFSDAEKRELAERNIAAAAKGR